MAEEMKDLLQNNAPENAEAVTESAAEGTENAERPKISMPAKEDILYEVDVHMNTSVLYDYMLRQYLYKSGWTDRYDHWRICHSLCNEKCRRFISDRRYCDHFISAVESLFKCQKAGAYK